MRNVGFHSQKGAFVLPIKWSFAAWIVLTFVAPPAILQARAEASERNRVADSAKVGLNNVVPPCQGRLFETYSESADENGWTYSLRLTCASSPSTAEWSLISNSKCYDAAGKACSSPTAKLIPPFSTPSISTLETRQTFTISYQLLKYGLGRNCQIAKQPFTSATLGPNVSTSTQAVWICAQLDFFDGTSNAGGLIADPKDYRAISVSTSSSQPLSVGNADENFPKEFLALPFLYSFELP
jgi:hypothetical protein